MSPDRLGNINQSNEVPPAVDGEKPEIVTRGISASPGIVIGTAFLKDSEILVVHRTPIAKSAVEDEISRFERALAEARKEVLKIKTSIADRMGADHARIFDSHLLILDDVMITEGTIKAIRADRVNAAASFEKVINRVLQSFGQIEDEYLKDRFVDVKDVKRRVIRNLLDKEGVAMERPTEPSIIVAHDLSPSDTAQLGRTNTLGYATDMGGRTSHVAIIARSQGIPAVVGLENLFDGVQNGDTLVVDGNTGTVVVNPSPETLENYRHEIARFQELEDQLLTLTGYPAVTLDDKDFLITANLDIAEEVESALEYGGQGVGLFRTEYFFISRDYLPSEDEQYDMYRSVVEQMGDKPVTFRTIDIGGDKIATYLHSTAELNPFMGWRGIRFCLTRKDIFKTQLRALYRASAHGNLSIMFPMVSQVEEVLQAKEICGEVRKELRANRFKFKENVDIGIMIETPAAVVLADQLAREVEFFSIGTNDLIQYTMAVDRGNSKIAHLYQNLHPAIVRFLRQTIEAGHRRDIKVSVCGEMCSDPLAVIILIGLQVDQFSSSPNMMPEVKRIIRSVTVDECRSLVKRIMRYRTTAEIVAEVEKLLHARVNNGRNGE